MVKRERHEYFSEHGCRHDERLLRAGPSDGQVRSEEGQVHGTIMLGIIFEKKTYASQATFLELSPKVADVID